MTSFQRLSYRHLIDVETTSRVFWEIRRWSKLREFFHSLYSTSRSKTLLNKTVEHAQQTKFQNISGKKSLVQLVNTFSFPGICPNIKRRLFSRTYLGRLLLKLMYWNKSINIMITTNEYQEQPPTIIEKFPKRQLWGGSVISKVDIILWHECFIENCLDIVTTYSFYFETSAENVRGQKSIIWKIALVSQCFLTRMLYSAVNFFAISSKSDGVFHWNWTSIYVFTNIMNNSVQHKKNCKTVRNEETSVRPWERPWNRVIHGKTARAERSDIIELWLLYCDVYY